MKKILLLFFISLHSAFANDYYPKTELYLDLKINYNQLPGACESIKKFKTESFSNYNELFCDETGFLYPSPIDTTVSIGMYFNDNFFWMERLGQYCEGDIGNDFITVGQKAKYEFSEVLKEEFIRLQQLGIFEISKDSAEKFIIEVIEYLKESFDACSDIDLAEFSGTIEDPISKKIGLYGCCSLVEDPTKMTGKFAMAAPGIRAVRVSDGRFYIRGAKVGAAFTLFDMNGKLLKEGVDQTGYIQSPVVPAILKIQNQVIMLK